MQQNHPLSVLEIPPKATLVSPILGEHPFRKTVYFIDPAGVEFEFMQYLSDKPSERNRYESMGTTTVDPEYASV
jgi:hypothetical protein